MLRSARLRFIFLAGIFFTSAVPAAHAQGRVDCDALKSHVLKQVVNYCVMLPSSYGTKEHSDTRYPVLYYLHGLGDNEQSLLNSGGWQLVEDLRQQHKIGDFLIAAPQGWRSFYINSADGKLRYSDFFLKEFMPYIEGKYRIRRERKERAITGISMGGYGALRFAFAHPELFGSVSAQSAALMSPRQLDMSMHSSTPVGKLLGNVFGDPINVSHWNENSPFALAKTNKSSISQLAIYFNCGDQDEYGFDNGAAALGQELRAEGVKHEFHLYPGNHSAAYFLSHFGETLEFHSRVFEDRR